MIRLKQFWQKTILRSHVWLFTCFLISFPLSIRKVLYFIPIEQKFNEYSGTYIYLSDIFLILTAATWTLFLYCNKNSFLSIKNTLSDNKPIFIFFSCLIFLALLSSLWSDYISLSFFGFFKLSEWLFMFLYIIVNVPRPPRVDSRPSDNLAGADKQSLPRVEAGGTFLKNFLLLLSILGILESFMGIIQFIIQHSIGIYWLKESNIHSGGAGIAKIIIDNQKFIRSYGTFPHPNIFAGFLTLSICATIILRFINNYSNIHKNIETNDYVKIVPRGTISFLLKKSLYIQIIALFLTFSKSAIFGLFAGFIIVNVPQIKNVFNNFNVSKNIFGLFKKNVLAYYLSALFALCIILFLFLQVNMHFFITQSIDERLFYINVSRGTIANNSIIGVGMNNFVLNMQKYSSLDLLDWQYQPVHNVFLLIWSELGFIGLFIFVCLLFYIIKKNYYHSLARISHANIFRTTNALILCQVFILLFDHYQWDIQQGEIIFWLSIALFFSINEYNNKLLYVVSKK